MPKKTFFCIDAHTCGNPVRLIAGGGPVLEGKNMSEKRQHFLAAYDWIRKGLMFEPRGHDMMSGSILYPPHDPSNDVAVLFIETSGCLPMCGHGTIGTITIAIEEGLIQPKIPGRVNMEAPAGLVRIEYRRKAKKFLPSNSPMSRPIWPRRISPSNARTLVPSTSTSPMEGTSMRSSTHRRISASSTITPPIS